MMKILDETADNFPNRRCSKTKYHAYIHPSEKQKKKPQKAIEAAVLRDEREREITEEKKKEEAQMKATIDSVATPANFLIQEVEARISFLHTYRLNFLRLDLFFAVSPLRN